LDTGLAFELPALVCIFANVAFLALFCCVHKGTGFALGAKSGPNRRRFGRGTIGTIGLPTSVGVFANGTIFAVQVIRHVLPRFALGTKGLAQFQ
jgi:hypothetical protein